MKPKLILLIILLTSIFWNCEKQCILPEEEIGTGEIISNASIHMGDTHLNELLQKVAGKCIQSDSQNVDMLKVSFDGGKNYEAIDFSKYTVLENFVSTGGCSVVYERNVSKDITHKKIVYTITIHQCGDCKKSNSSWNWVLVPKIPEDYTIEYKVIEKKVKEKLRFK